MIVGTTGGTANGITSVFVMKTDASLNSSATISEVFDITSVNPLYTENTLYIYPNPTSNNITFSSQSNILNHPYKIFNLLGEVVRNGILKSEQIDISDLINGVYFINIPSISNKSYPFTKI